MASLDHLYGRSVESVDDGGQEEAHWIIRLEGGSAIYNFDTTHDKPAGIDKLGFTAAAFDKETTRLWFGTADNPRGTVINLIPTEYAVSDPVLTEGKIVKPQAAPETQAPAVPPEPEDAADRTAEGPEDE